MKLLVETTGSFQIFSNYPEQWVRHNRPSVVRTSTFIDIQVGKKQLNILGQLNDNATDEAFVNALSEAKSKDLAVAAFLAEFPIDAEAQVEEKPAKPARAPKAEKPTEA